MLKPTCIEFSFENIKLCFDQRNSRKNKIRETLKCKCTYFGMKCVKWSEGRMYTGDSILEYPVRHTTFFNIFQSGDHTKKEWSFVLWSCYYGKVTLYGWWLLEEGTSRNVPIAGFEMILREDISPETKSRDLYSSRNIISNPKILGTFRDVPDNKVAICYIVWLPIALPGFGIARRNLQNSVFFSAGISFKLCAVQCVSIVLCAAVQRVSIVLCAQ